ncbi:MAG: sugar-binding transcriptional regulator [Halanaerobiales bacterium]
MKYLFKIQKKIVPELISLAEIRYTILRTVNYNQPIGRRSLASKLDLSERSVRNQLEFLHSINMLEITRAGTVITPAGRNFLPELDKYIKEIRNIRNLEKKLKKVMELERVFIVPGELEYATIKQEIGRFTADILQDYIEDGDIIAVTGGSTLAGVARSMPYHENHRDVMVVPARGGIGEKVEIQANTVAAEIAKKLGGSYRLLHVPDNINKENIGMITSEPSIKKALNYLGKANLLLHGVGTADDMAERRDMNEEDIKLLEEKGAIGEAFGIYFDYQGCIVYSTTCVGLNLKALKNVDRVIAVAGGVNKAQAITAVVSPEYHDVLITDEKTAVEIIALKGG